MIDKVVAIKALAQALLKEAELLNAQSNDTTAEELAFYDKVRDFEISLIRTALIRTGGHQRRAARLLGLNATTLNSKLKAYHIAPALIATAQDHGDERGEQRETPTPAEVDDAMSRLEADVSYIS